MEKATHINEEDLSIENIVPDTKEIKGIGEDAEDKNVCGHLQVVRTTDTYFEVRATQNGRRFRFVFSVRNNGRTTVTSIGPTISTIRGRNYSGTARRGRNVGIQCLS